MTDENVHAEVAREEATEVAKRIAAQSARVA